MYLKDSNGFLSHRKDVSGRLKHKRMRKSEQIRKKRRKSGLYFCEIGNKTKLGVERREKTTFSS
jgi:hypothetical protein